MQFDHTVEGKRRIIMITKRVTALLMSIVMVFTMLTAMPLYAAENTADNISAELSSALQGEDISITPLSASASATALRRPVSAEQPMWIVHIDSWNYADPEKIIDLIPEDILPYVVFNISLSINWDSTNHKWLMVQDGYSTAKSWLRTCADKGVWTMIQPSSGGQSHFPDYYAGSSAGESCEGTLYEEFFKDYPNFIGYNYCEQFWGFESADFPITCPNRYRHFANLLELCNKYGGYLDISWCGNQWSPSINPLAMLKQIPEWESACSKYHQNLILEEKYTQGSYIADMESLVYGYYISGYCDNFGVRYDETGWTDSTWSGTGTSTKDEYRVSTGLPIHIERMAMNGATVIDGPELVWAEDFKELSTANDSDGYAQRRWGTHTQFDNVMMDMFRKVLDGTIRIPDREEVIGRTKVVVIQDISGSRVGFGDNLYSTYETLFEGLYRASGDGNLKDNHNLYKSTGRYQTIPTVYALRDDLAKSIPVQVKQSEISTRWATIADKQAEFNSLYPADVTYGNSFAARNENTWLTYNPNKNGTAAGSVLSLKYNTCKTLDVSHSNKYGMSVVNEYTDHIDVYLNNYDQKTTDLSTDILTISGAASKPSVTYKDRGISQSASNITTDWTDGVYKITVEHNGPVDITIKCSGSETNRLTAYKTASYTPPEFPSFYTGARQYEGEFFDRKNIEENVTNGCNSGITGYQGQGFMKFGTSSSAAVKDTVRTNKAGTFDMTLRYAVTSATKAVDLYVNGSKVKTLSLPATSSLSDWTTVTEQISLKEGENKVEFKANATLPSTLYLDNFVVEGDFGSEEITVTPINGTLIKNLIVSDSENAADWSIEYNFGKGSLLFGDRSLTCEALPSTLSGCEYIRTACDSKLVTSDLGTFETGAATTIYIAMDTRVTASLPAWLADWTKTEMSVSTTDAASNSLTLAIYQKSFSAGETVKLGTNGGNGNSVNYIVLASSVKGDVNLDGNTDDADAQLLQKYIINSASLNKEQGIQADLNNNSIVNSFDLLALKNQITPKAISPEAYMAQVSANVVESEPSDATSEISGVTYGTFEKKTFYSDVCKRNKSINVLLPAGYNTNKKYPVLYALHGYWGNEDSLLDAGDASLKLRQIIGNAIAAGEAEEMIVVFPNIYASDTQDACSALDDANNAAYDNFINVLTKEIMPYMESNYSIKTGRDNTAITGFSMGGRESLYIGFSRPDLFGYIGAMCPAPRGSQISESDWKFTNENTSPYLLFVSGGSSDTIVYSTPEGYHNTFTNNGVTHIWHYVTGGDHGGKTIRPHMYNFVRAIFKAA